LPPHRFHAAIPAWRHLAASVREAQSDDERITARLRTCGLTWHDVTTNSERLRRALAIADRN